MSTRTWLATDYYALLGVTEDASDVEISRAFRDLAKQLHPDRTTNGEESRRFKELAAAYGVVGKAEHRARYDAIRATQRTTPAAPDQAAHAIIREDDSHRPISVRALPSFRAGRLAYRWGIALFVIGLAAGALVGWIISTADGPTDVARDITLWLVAAKIVVVGMVFFFLGRRRLAHHDSGFAPKRVAASRYDGRVPNGDGRP